MSAPLSPTSQGALQGASTGAYVVMAQIGAAHGVRGEARLKVFAEAPETLAGRTLLLPDDRPLRVLRLRQVKGEMYVAAFEGVSDRDAVEALKLKTLRLARADLPAIEEEDAFYIADLVGLDVRDAAGAVIGRVGAIHDFGAGDVLELALADRGAAYAPFTRAAVPEVNVAQGHVVVVLDAEDGADEGERGV